MTRVNSMMLAVGLAVVSTSPAIATLGEREAVAVRRASEWQTKYGAVAPIVKTDGSGNVNFECWSAPPEGWDQKTALAFGMDLLPADARNLTPERVSSRSCNNAFQVSGRYDICLSGIGGSIFDVSAATTSYTGPSC